MSQVSIVKCSDYEQKKVDEAVKKSLEFIGGLREVVSPGDKVLLKVNMINSDFPQRAATTHPAVVRSMIRLVKQAGGKPFLGDAPGVAYDEVEKAWRKTGFKRAAAEEGVPVVNFMQAAEINNSKNKKVPTLYIAREVMDSDVVISLPKLKTHTFALFTGALKNLYGVIPGFTKKEIHAKAPKPSDFAEVVVDVVSLVEPKLAVMDAVVGMEGSGPVAGSTRKVGLILASTDLVALDTVSSSIIGYKPLDVDIIKTAHKRGLGEARIKRINIRGEALDKVKIRDFELIYNINTLLNKMPSFLLVLARVLAPYFLKVEPEIDQEKCVGCGACADSCPKQAITAASNPKIDRKKCIRCFCCQEVCPQKAVGIRHNWLARKLKI